MDVSVIIPVYRRTEWLERCLERLTAQDFNGSFEIVISDDGSPNSKDFQSMVDRFSSDHTKIRYLKNDHAGPAATRNFGVRNSTGKILCFIDDDSLPEKGWLSEIIKPFESNSVGMVNGQTLSYEREGLPLMLEGHVYRKKCWATCNIAYRRDVFESQKGFDEAFPEPSWEDNDLGLRTKWAGFEHVYNEQAIVHHPHERTMDEYKKKCILNGRGAAVFSKKYLYKKPLWGIGTPLVMARYIVFVLHPTVWFRNINSPAYLKFLWSYCSIKGFIRVLRGNNGKD